MSTVLLTVCAPVLAQAPVFEPMPEGSRDAFVGLSLAHRPLYDGAASSRWTLDPTLQVSWSSGLFLSGSTAGWHLGEANTETWPRWDWGAMLNLRAPRNANGSAWFLDTPQMQTVINNGNGGNDAHTTARQGAASKLRGMREQALRVEYGGFLNWRMTPGWQWAHTVLGGPTREGSAWTWRSVLHHHTALDAAHHSLSLSLGLTWANAAAMRTDFGVDAEEVLSSGNRFYRPGAGWRDWHAEARWNWALHPSWVLSTAVHWTHWQGEAARSPLVERAQGLRLSTGLVHRF